MELKLDNGIETKEYSFRDMLERWIEDFYEDLEEKYGCSGNCTNESVAHCECEPVFENNEFIELEIILGK